jgi:hypothetical protein
VDKRLRSAVGNLGVYALCLGVTPDQQDRQAVAALVSATFPEVTPDEIATVVGLQAPATVTAGGR